MSECIHYNTNITINERVVYTKDWFDAGIVLVHHLTYTTDTYLTFQNNLNSCFQMSEQMFSHNEVSLVL